MYKTHIKLQPAEGPTMISFTSYTDQFKADAKRSNFDTDKTWYTELNKWTDHLTDVDKAELIELQKKLQRKFVSDDRMKAKHRGWKCKRKDNDCEVPIRMRKFMLVLDKEIRKKLKESLDIQQRSSVIDVVKDFKRKGLVKHLQRFVLFCGDIRQNIHHIVQFIKFYVDNKDDISKSSTPTSSTDMPEIITMPLKNTEDDNSEAFKKAMKLVQSYMAWGMSFLEPAEGRFLSAEPGAHAPLLAHMLFGNPVEYIFTSLLGLIKTFVGFPVIVIAILCLLAWLCPTEPTSRTHNDMEQRIQEEQDMQQRRRVQQEEQDIQQRRRVHEKRRRVHESTYNDLVKKYGIYPEYAALSKKYYGVIPLSELKKLAVMRDDLVKKYGNYTEYAALLKKMREEKTFEKCADYWDGMCPICLIEMEKKGGKAKTKKEESESEEEGEKKEGENVHIKFYEDEDNKDKDTLTIGKQTFKKKQEISGYKIITDEKANKSKMKKYKGIIDKFHKKDGNIGKVQIKLQSGKLIPYVIISGTALDKRQTKVKCCNCGHSFHESCINEWLQTHMTCPICRKPCGEGLVLGKIDEALKTLVAKKDELEKAKTKREAEKREQQRDEEEKKDDNYSTASRWRSSSSDDSESDDSDSDDPEDAYKRWQEYENL